MSAEKTIRKNNMLSGSPFKALLLFTLPLVLGNLFQQMYNMVDSIIVGQYVGQTALAAVGSTTTVCHVYIAVALGLSTGCMIVFSQLFGAKRIARMKTAMYTALISIAVLSIIALIVGFFTTEWIMNSVLHFENGSSLMYEDARTYYVIYALGFPALFMYNIANSVFNSIGKSQYTLSLLIGTSLLNVGLDLWFVVGLKMGVAGAAIATDISQYISAVVAVIWMLVYLRKNFKTEEKSAAFEFKLLGNMLKIAIPTMLAQVVVAVGYTALQSLVNRFNVDIISGYVAAFRLDSLCVVPMIQIGNAIATYTGQNVGAKQFDRVNKGIGSAALMCVVIWVVFIGAVLLFGHDMIGWFMNADASSAAYNAGVQYMRVMSFTYIILGLMYIYAAALRGAGDAIVSVIAVIMNFAGRCAFAYIMVAVLTSINMNTGFFDAFSGTPFQGSEVMIWWSNPIGWFIALAICFIRFQTGKWKTKRIADKV